MTRISDIEKVLMDIDQGKHATDIQKVFPNLQDQESFVMALSGNRLEALNFLGKTCIFEDGDIDIHTSEKHVYIYHKTLNSYTPKEMLSFDTDFARALVKAGLQAEIKKEQAHEKLSPDVKEIAPDMSSLSAIIELVTKRYQEQGLDTWDIGNGHCENFAYEVMELWQGEDWIHNEGDEFLVIGTEQVSRDLLFEDVLDIDLLEKHWGGLPYGVSPEDVMKIGAPGHVWIYSRGRHYDAETPEGVERILDLPFFRRHIASHMSQSKDQSTNEGMQP